MLTITKQPGEEWEIWFGLNNTQMLIQAKDQAMLDDQGLVVLHSDKGQTRVFVPAHAINRVVTRKSTQLDDYYTNAHARQAAIEVHQKEVNTLYGSGVLAIEP